MRADKRICLSEQKEVELRLLEQFDVFCQKHGLKYYLYGGTLLGAVRHKGFIPWDDDIDIVMPRADYNQFERLFNEDKENDNAVLLTATNTERYFYAFGKIVATDTILIEKNMKVPIELGVYIDIFPLERCPNDVDTAWKFYIRNVKLWRYAILHKEFYITHSQPIKKLYSFAFYNLLRPFSSKTIMHRIEKNCRCYEKREECNRFVAPLCTITNKTEIMHSEWFKDAIQLEFEGKMFPAPKAHHEVLSALYGDYMRLPPENERKTNHDIEIFWK